MQMVQLKHVKCLPLPPGIPDSDDAEYFIDTLSDEDEYNFVADKKVLIILLKKFLAAVMPPPAFTNKAVPVGVVPGRVPVPALASILAPNPSITDFGYYGLQEWRLLALLIMTR
jgi:hypothetical protein